MPTKKFSSARRSRNEDPIEFEIEGEEQPFLIPQPVPGALLLDVMEGTEEENPAKVVKVFNVFLKETLGPKEFDRYRRATINARMDVGEVMEVTSYVIEQAAQVPTQQRSSSQESSSTTTPGQAVAATEN